LEDVDRVTSLTGTFSDTSSTSVISEKQEFYISSGKITVPSFFKLSFKNRLYARARRVIMSKASKHHELGCTCSFCCFSMNYCISLLLAFLYL